MSPVIPAEGSATVSLSDAARILGVGKSTAYELVKRGEFPIHTITIGSKVRVPLVHLERFLLGPAHGADESPAASVVGQQGDHEEAVA